MKFKTVTGETFDLPETPLLTDHEGELLRAFIERIQGFSNEQFMSFRNDCDKDMSVKTSVLADAQHSMELMYEKHMAVNEEWSKRPRWK